MAFVLYVRPSSRNAIFCRFLDAIAAATEFLAQAVVSGFSFAAGYGIGIFGGWLWAYMELPEPRGHVRRVVKYAAATGCAGIT
jgi:uncharacterized membrane protein